MTGRKTWLAATTALACVLGASPALADTTTDLLTRLHQRGILSDEEYRQLMASHSAEQAAPAPAAVTTAQPASAQSAASGALDMGSVVQIRDGGMQMGDVNIKFSGSINGFYVHENGDTPSATTTVVGGLAGVGPKSSSVRNGLLPGFLKVDVTTVQGGWNIGAHFGLYPGINSVSGVGGANSAGTPQALATAGIDFRQTYMTIGREGFGELKIGRDIGLFGSEGILNDITLLSVGTATGNSAPSNTSLGRIGLGYIYTDFQPQITWTSPKFGGLQLTAGIFQPLVTIGENEVNKQPGFQAKLVYADTWGDVSGRFWLSGISQKHDGFGGSPSYTGRAFDVGGKVSFGPASLLGYYYNGTGIGTTGLFILSTDAAGRRRDSDGFYLQGTLTFGKVTVGGSYGESHLDLADGEVNPTLLSSNSSWVGQVRYGLTSWVTLVSEFVHTRAEAHGPNKASSDAFAAGAILFF